MSIKQLLLWEKYRPKTLEDIILLPRIRKRFENGVSQHYIFHGHYGTGKTSLARILIGRYSKTTPYLEVNCSENTSIDFLREEISDFCKFSPMMETDSDVKYVFLDEFERVSASFQDAFKAFIEKYNGSVRFIINTNHLDKITPGLQSRIKKLNFDCQNLEEEKYLKQEIYKRIATVILPAQNSQVKKENLVTIITKKFPDFREMLVELQDFIEVGDLDATACNISNKLKLDLYEALCDSSLSYDDIYHFLMNNFGPDGIHNLIKVLGRPFIDWSIEQNKCVDKLFQCNYIITECGSKLETNTDQIVLGMTIIGKFRDILN